MTTWNDLPNELKGPIIASVLESTLKLRYKYLACNIRREGREVYSQCPPETCLWATLHSLEEIWPGTQEVMLTVARGIKRDCELELKQFVEKTPHWIPWRAKEAAEMLADLIDELQTEREPGKGCWACRMQHDIMTNIAWTHARWASAKLDVDDQANAAVRLNMHDHFKRDRLYGLFKERWNSVWSTKFMLAEMWKATMMSRSEIDKRVREKYEASRRSES